MFWLDDVKSQKAKGFTVAYGRDTSYWLFVQQSHKEPLWIRLVKTVCIVQPRVPTFKRGPIDGQIDFVAGHFANHVISIMLHRLRSPHCCLVIPFDLISWIVTFPNEVDDPIVFVGRIC